MDPFGIDQVDNTRKPAKAPAKPAPARQEKPVEKMPPSIKKAMAAAQKVSGTTAPAQHTFDPFAVGSSAPVKAPSAQDDTVQLTVMRCQAKKIEPSQQKTGFGGNRQQNQKPQWIRNNAVKTFTKGSEGKVTKSDFELPFLFDAYQVDVPGGTKGMSAFLTEISKDPHAFIVRGAPARENPLPRRKHEQNGVTPGLMECPRRFVMIDADKVPLPEGMDGVERPEEAIAWYVEEKLPEPFKRAGYHWQLSSSAGIPVGDKEPNNQVINAHIWFVLDREIPDRALEMWLEEQSYINDENRTVVDPTVARTVQPNYTALPQLKGFEDPVKKREGYEPGGMVKVPDRDWDRLEQDILATRSQVNSFHRWVLDGMPMTEEAQQEVRDARRKELQERGFSGTGGDWIEQLVGMGDAGGHRGFNEPLVQAAASYVSIHGHLADPEKFKEVAREYIDQAPRSQDRDPGDIERYKSDMYLDEIVSTATQRFGQRGRMKDGGMERVDILDDQDVLLDRGQSSDIEAARKAWQTEAERLRAKGFGDDPQKFDFNIAKTVARDYTVEAAAKAMLQESDVKNRERYPYKYAVLTCGNAALDTRSGTRQRRFENTLRSLSKDSDAEIVHDGDKPISVRIGDVTLTPEPVAKAKISRAGEGFKLDVPQPRALRKEGDGPFNREGSRGFDI